MDGRVANENSLTSLLETTIKRELGLRFEVTVVVGLIETR